MDQVERLNAYQSLTPAEIESLQRAMAEADAGLVVPADEVFAWLNSMGTENELPLPETHRAA